MALLVLSNRKRRIWTAKFDSLSKQKFFKLVEVQYIWLGESNWLAEKVTDNPQKRVKGSRLYDVSIRELRFLVANEKPRFGSM
jgi:hypothetical protein